MKPPLLGMFSSIVDLVLPPSCRLCETPIAPEQVFCSPCERSLRATEPWLKKACPRCGLPGVSLLADNITNSKPFQSGILANQVTCPHCRDRQLSVDRTIALWIYRDCVADAVVTAKYVGGAPLANALGCCLGQRVAEQFACSTEVPPPSIVTDVPSHFWRQFGRGGASIKTLAGAVAKQIHCRHRSLLRVTRQIPKQALLDDESRKQNVAGAFRLCHRLSLPGISSALAGQHILIVDDVLTTGATMNEVARVLKIAGASRVTAAVVARAVRKG